MYIFILQLIIIHVHLYIHFTTHYNTCIFILQLIIIHVYSFVLILAHLVGKYDSSG